MKNRPTRLADKSLADGMFYRVFTAELDAKVTLVTFFGLGICGDFFDQFSEFFTEWSRCVRQNVVLSRVNPGHCFRYTDAFFND